MYSRDYEKGNLLRVSLSWCNNKNHSARLTILEPTATPRLNVNLSFTETDTAVTCSKEFHEFSLLPQRKSNLPAALPTIGSKMIPTNSVVIAPVATKPLIESTNHSAVTATS